MKRLSPGILVFFCLILPVLVGAFFFMVNSEIVDFSSLEHYQLSKPSVVLDAQGREMYRFELDKRTPITYDKMPDILIKAFVATEDHDFFTHSGFSLRGMARSFFVNLLHRRVVQGASTISQQLIRSMFLTYERTFTRKFKELFLAIQLERQFSKQQILELYLNNIYFGRGIYGVEAACRRLWDKPVSQLTPAQAATLAAVAASARLFSPLNAPLNTIKRRNVILGSMLNLGFINEKQYKQSIVAELDIHEHMQGNPIRMYIYEWVRIWAEGIWGKDALYRRGLRIKTSIDVDMQEKAERSFKAVIERHRATMGQSLNGGMLSVEPWSGKIRVMIGGFDFKKSQFNRATQAFRQIGSSFKPIYYALALQQGIGADTVFVDEPFEMVQPNGMVWTPKNVYGDFDGQMTLLKALTYSNNIVSIKLFLKLGAQNVVDWARKFELSRELHPVPSLALGIVEATVEENVAAFNVFANNGEYVKPYMIESVRDEFGAKLWDAPAPNRHAVLDAKTNTQMVNMLEHRQHVVRRGTPGPWIDAESIGKTGTNNSATTTWFVGATPELTTAIYVGRDDNKSMGDQMYASSTTFPIWLNFYRTLQHTRKQFYLDPSLHEVTINWVTGERSSDLANPDVISILK
ncbi:MAG: transglycosylase domain-containing protein [Candidatus Babeliales bacterium]